MKYNTEACYEMLFMIFRGESIFKKNIFKVLLQIIPTIFSCLNIQIKLPF